MRRRVVITGIGCVSPLGVGVEPFWQSLARGESGIARISHFDSSGFEVQLAGEVKEKVAYPQEFARFVTEDGKLAFALNAAMQAMQDANLKEFATASLLHLGTSLEQFDLQKIMHGSNTLYAYAPLRNEGENLYEANFASLVRHFLAKEARPLQMPLDTACELVEKLYGKAGMKLTNVGACAASTQAIGHAYHCIRRGMFDMALCGGFDSMLNPLGVGGFQLLGALSTNNEHTARACRPFDAARSGAVLGEGAAMLVMETLAAAQKAGKRIYGEIVGYGTSLDAYKLSAPDPGGIGAIASMQKSLQDAQLQPGDIHAVSTHGTGTHLNDEVEAAAIRSVLGESWRHTPVVSTKSLIGHLIGAAGAVEFIASLQGFAQGQLHANGSLENIGKGCELDHIVRSPRAFSGKNILKNSFGFGGQNATLIISKVENQDL
jgi:3-oxoacyl-[acyl-carrier-protein] synthase II